MHVRVRLYGFHSHRSVTVPQEAGGISSSENMVLIDVMLMRIDEVTGSFI